MRRLLLVLSWAVSHGSAAFTLAGIPCGKQGGGTELRQGRIKGGMATNISKYPYAVSLQTANREHLCGGSLVKTPNQRARKFKFVSMTALQSDYFLNYLINSVF